MPTLRTSGNRRRQIRIGRLTEVTAPERTQRGYKAMAIYRLIANGSFEPNVIEAMTAAYEGALSDLEMTDRNDPFTELIAKAIINVTATGERDPEKIKGRALSALGVRKVAAA